MADEPDGIGAGPARRGRQRSARIKKAVLRPTGDRPVLGRFFNGPLDVPTLRWPATWRANWASRMLFTSLEGES